MATFFLKTPFLSLFFLFGALVLTICNTALQSLGKFQAKEWLRSPSGKISFFFYSLLHNISAKREWESLYFSLSIAKQVFQLCYVFFSFFYLLADHAELQEALLSPLENHPWAYLLQIALFLIAILLALDFSARLLASRWDRALLKISSFFASLYLILLFPLVAPLVALTHIFCPTDAPEEGELVRDKRKLQEIIRESELHQHLEPGDQKLISSFINFKERVAKEIMVPRVDLFSLEATIPIREASRLFAEQGYSRIPIYKESLDQVMGVVLYKDLLGVYAIGGNLDAPLMEIAKPVLYAPENKRISLLLQEFKTKQIHMAIVVDEYGGTEGIVTIEDILEELVGEIEDESDIGEEHDHWELPGGGWAINPKMTIHDLEEELGIRIPDGPEYETVGGYVYHIAGTIPAKGWRFSHDQFELEVLSSNERAIRKIKIVPRSLGTV